MFVWIIYCCDFVVIVFSVYDWIGCIYNVVWLKCVKCWVVFIGLCEGDFGFGGIVVGKGVLF